MFIFNTHVPLLCHKKTSGFPGMSAGNDDFYRPFLFFMLRRLKKKKKIKTPALKNRKLRFKRESRGFMRVWLKDES